MGCLEHHEQSDFSSVFFCFPVVASFNVMFTFGIKYFVSQLLQLKLLSLRERGREERPGEPSQALLSLGIKASGLRQPRCDYCPLFQQESETK